MAPLVEDEEEDTTDGAMKKTIELETAEMMQTRTFGGPPISLESKTMPTPQFPIFSGVGNARGSGGLGGSGSVEGGRNIAGHLHQEQAVVEEEAPWGCTSIS